MINSFLTDLFILIITYFFLQNNTDRQICAKLLVNKNEGYVKNLKHRVRIFVGLENSYIHFFTGPILLFGYYLDLIKDTILVYRLQFILGGFTAIFTHYNKFSSIVSTLDNFMILLSNSALDFFVNLFFLMQFPIERPNINP